MKSVKSLIVLGKSQLKKGDFNAALNLFEQATLLDQKNADLEAQDFDTFGEDKI